MRKFFRVIITAVLTLLMVTLIVGSVSAWWIPPPGPFDDVPWIHWAVDHIWWLKDNGITTGYPDNTFRPESNVTRAEMAAFLHREAGALVAAGIHVKRGAGGPYIGSWFNNINNKEPIVTTSDIGKYKIDFQFPMDDKFLQCTIDFRYVSTYDQVCSASIDSSGVSVWIFDTGEVRLRRGEFWVLVYGNDIQP